MKNLKQYILEKILINKDTTYNVEYEKVEEVDNFDDFIGYLHYNKYTYENVEALNLVFSMIIIFL